MISRFASQHFFRQRTHRARKVGLCKRHGHAAQGKEQECPGEGNDSSGNIQTHGGDVFVRESSTPVAAYTISNPLWHRVSSEPARSDSRRFKLLDHRTRFCTTSTFPAFTPHSAIRAPDWLPRNQRFFPEPLIGIVCGLPAALLLMLMAARRCPVPVGRKVT